MNKRKDTKQLVAPEKVKPLRVSTKRKKLVAKNSSNYCFRDDKNRYTVVYIIQHTSGCFYIGVHTSDHKNPILTSYMTSSFIVKSIMEVDGVDSFSLVRQFYCATRSQANLLENVCIEHNRPQDNLFILNKSFGVNIVDWEPIDYKGKALKLNKNCKLFSDQKDMGTGCQFTLPKNLPAIKPISTKAYGKRKNVSKPVKENCTKNVRRKIHEPVFKMTTEEHMEVLQEKMSKIYITTKKTRNYATIQD